MGLEPRLKPALLFGGTAERGPDQASEAFGRRRNRSSILQAHQQLDDALFLDDADRKTVHSQVIEESSDGVVIVHHTLSMAPCLEFFSDAILIFDDLRQARER